ncbi:MAG: class I SAM-dependent methyltransferase [Candidatus Lernaella stagnicola]|nr:class I SAM-dependent methyltransferase [Candidatus Lernaella stagnicola]
MFRLLQEINTRPAPFACYGAADLWTDEHISSRMLQFHLDDSIDAASRNSRFIERSVGWMISRFGLNETKNVADFGCGPGLYTTRLAQSDAAVTGIDFSERSIRYAQETARRGGLSVDHVCADYLEYETGKRFDLITMIMCDFCALGPAQRRALLTKFFSLLKPGGEVLFDAYSLHAFDDREEQITHAPQLMDGFWSAAPYFGFLNTFKYEQEKVMLDKYTIIEAARTRVIYNWLQYFDQDSLKKEIEDCGLVVQEFLSDVVGKGFDPASHEFAVIAAKPAGA